jgi:erythromycin esterase-like protein
MDDANDRTSASARITRFRTPSRISRLTFVALALVSMGASCSRANETGPDASDAGTVALVREAAIPLTGNADDYDALIPMLAGARVVMLGEATHGTHEFYRERARITQRLIAEAGFSAVAIEGDWPDAYSVNQYVRGLSEDGSAEQALSSFTEFPRWMWRNQEIRDLVDWMRSHNEERPAADRAGFYGLDVYSLYESIDEVLAYLDNGNPSVAARVRPLYACFGSWRPEAQDYGAATRQGVSCEAQAAEALGEVSRLAEARPEDPAAAEAMFSALRNAHTVANAEQYFRTAYVGHISTWNIRDQEMSDALVALEGHLRATSGREPKIVVWSHNTHTGDARVTEAGDQGEFNIGQLTRQRLGDDAFLVGFHTYTGTVFAASSWGAPGRVQSVRPALPGSYSRLFHATGIPDFLLVLRGAGETADALTEPPRLQRAIGVIYAPATERQSHYFMARLGQQFDAIVFLDTTRAVTPLP